MEKITVVMEENTWGKMEQRVVTPEGRRVTLRDIDALGNGCEAGAKIIKELKREIELLETKVKLAGGAA